ncbi:MAG: hypothetical protein ACD_75C00344G0001 [uncultured bacterium]|nr:MAG: hypothetical protein ACD_75C00344G0001 [uncultured bacterium]
MIASISSCRSSAMSFRHDRPQVPDREKTMIGICDRFTSKTEGSSSRSLGRSPLAWSTLSLTSCRALSISVPVTNSTLIIDLPSELIDEIFFKPSSPFSFFSISVVTAVSISVGETPLYSVDTKTLGMVMSGSLSRGSA